MTEEGSLAIWLGTCRPCALTKDLRIRGCGGVHSEELLPHLFLASLQIGRYLWAARLTA